MRLLVSRRAAFLPVNTALSRAFSRGRDAAASERHVAKIQTTPHLKRKLGQHLLITEKILTDIVDAAALPSIIQEKQRDAGSQAVVRVLEIGPGTGNLTSALLAVSPAVHVHSVEYDARMVERLQARFQADDARLLIENCDFEDFEFGSGDDAPHVDACVANIPYQLSSLVISRLTNYMYRYPSQLRCAVLLVQDEFAQRLLAQPGTQNYSRLSVNTALIADVTSVVKVGRNHFLPPPKVDSRVIKLTPKAVASQDGAALLPADADQSLFFQRFDTLLRVVFLRKNKTLRAALLNNTARSLMVDSDGQPIDKTVDRDQLSGIVEESLAALELTTKRAVQLPVQDFVGLMAQLKTRGILFRPSDTRHFRD
ncbi:hypothetical protein P43SY_008454 [Pythium insidiosum]|uniref:rRNA adenine N(6)-methyltransferase n=1 Tax=Pythium insidiosum TaxID=114742 RepID=A0AAD5QCW4_PYTIN|nr:hypothetical protein P43SY_008454 [Pythium insidiosum]